MIATSYCVHCQNTIEFNAEAAGQTTPCPHCGKETLLRLPAPPQLTHTPAKPVGNPVLAHLKFIRKNTSYRELRSFIRVCFRLLVASVGLYACFSWLETTVGGGTDGAGGALATTMLGLIAIAILVAARQSAFVVLDIADTLLHQHSK